MRNVDSEIPSPPIRLLRISIPQRLRGDFCNKTCQLHSTSFPRAGSRSASGVRADDGCAGANEVNDVERQIVVDHVAEKQLNSDDDGNAQTDW